MKRMMQRQGQVGPDGAPAAPKQRQPAPRPAARPTTAQRTRPAQFLREVRGELRKVAWPTRAEVVNYSTVVLATLVILILLILALDYTFSKSVLFLFKS
jgi:preprotein translocase subunit SecE